MLFFSYRNQIIAALSMLTCLGSSILPTLAAEQTEQKVEQETIKARTSIWREANGTPENPSNLTVQATFPDKVWWEQFQDPDLSRYIQQAINANLNLAAAHERIEEARAMARQTMGREFPQVSLGATFVRSRNSATIIRTPRTGNAQNSGNNGQGGNSGGGAGGGAFALGQAISFYSVPLNVSYEADIWRKNRDYTRAADAQAEAVQRDFQATHVIVATDVASAYFNLLAADELLSLQKEVIATAESDLGHAQRRFEAGLTDEENVVLRQGRLTDYKAQLQGFYELQALALNQLAVLMGRTPAEVSTLPRASWQQYHVPNEVAVGIPSELLARRPDILAAEDRLAASGFQVRAARKELLPSINLTGQFGFATATLSRLFDWESYVASAGASLLQGIYTGGQAKANLRAVKSRYEQQLFAYRNTILQAFREVDDSLASLKAHRNAHQEYEASLGSLQQREQIQQNRLAAGAISEADTMPVRLEVMLAREGLTRTKLATLSDTLSLYKALGGGY